MFKDRCLHVNVSICLVFVHVTWLYVNCLYVRSSFVSSIEYVWICTGLYVWSFVCVYIWADTMETAVTAGQKRGFPWGQPELASVFAEEILAEISIIIICKLVRICWLKFRVSSIFWVNICAWDRSLSSPFLFGSQRVNRPLASTSSLSLASQPQAISSGCASLRVRTGIAALSWETPEKNLWVNKGGALCQCN